MNGTFTKYKPNPNETDYERFAKIFGQKLVDFEKIGDNDYYVIKRGDSKGTYCVRVTFGKGMPASARDIDGYAKRSAITDGYTVSSEYSSHMGKKPLSERLFNMLQPYKFSDGDKQIRSNRWRQRQQQEIEAKKRIKLRVGDILRFSRPIEMGSKEDRIISQEIKCLSLNPLRFAMVRLNGCLEEYHGSYFVPRSRMLEAGFQFLERGKRNRNKAVSCFNLEEHLAKLSEAIEKFGGQAEVKKPARKKRTTAIAEDNRPTKKPISCSYYEDEDDEDSFDAQLRELLRRKIS